MVNRGLKYSSEELAVLKTFYPEGGVKAVQSYIKRSPDSIRHTAMKHGITRVDMFRHTKINYSWLLDLSSPISCYCLGLLWGDGSVIYNNKTRQYRCYMRLLKNDMLEVCNLFKGFRYREQKFNNSWQTQGEITADSQVLVNDLTSYGFLTKSNTNPTKLLADMPINNHTYFIRGFLDADGHISKTNVIFSGAYDLDWIWLKTFCNIHNISCNTRYYISRKGHRSSRLEITKKANAIKFLDLIYTDDNIGLSRKRIAYITMKQLIIHWRHRT